MPSRLPVPDTPFARNARALIALAVTPTRTPSDRVRGALELASRHVPLGTAVLFDVRSGTPNPVAFAGSAPTPEAEACIAAVMEHTAAGTQLAYRSRADALPAGVNRMIVEAVSGEQGARAMLALYDGSDDPFSEACIELTRLLAHLLTGLLGQIDAEDELELQRARVELHTEAAGIAHWTYERRSGRLSGLDALFRLHDLGTPPQRIEDALELVHPDDRKGLLDELEAVVRAGTHPERRFRMRRTDGAWRWFASRGRSVSLPGDDEPRYLVGAVIDVHQEQLEAEATRARLARIERHNEALREMAVVASSADDPLPELARIAAAALDVERVSVWQLSADGGSLRVVSGYDHEDGPLDPGEALPTEALGQYFEEMRRSRALGIDDPENDPRVADVYESYIVPHGIKGLIDAAVRIGGIFRGVVCHESRSHRRHWTDDELLFAGAVGDQIALVMQSAEHAAEREQRHELETRMLEAQRLESLGMLAGGIAHDFNNLLVSMLGNIDIARRRLPHDHPSARSLAGADLAANRAADLCTQLLAYSGRGRFQIESLDICRELDDIGTLLETAVARRGSLRFDCQERLPGVRADATQFRQILLNLVTNAAEALPDTGGSIVVRARALAVGEAPASGWSELTEGTYVQIDVADDGAGMDEATQARMFDPFYTTKFTGRGLGLAAVQGIVHGHGGAIRVRSTPGIGTTLSFALQADPEATVQADDPTATGTAPLGGGMVLVIDDQELVRETAAALLQELGYLAVRAASGAEAVEMFAQSPRRFAFALLDVTMPGMSGRECFEQLRRIRDDLPIVVMSGYDAGDESLGFARGANASFLHKPFRVRALVEAVQTASGEGS